MRRPVVDVGSDNVGHERGGLYGLSCCLQYRRIGIRKTWRMWVALLTKTLGRSAVKDMLPMQRGDVAETFADLMRDTGHRPKTFSSKASIEDGITNFVAWYRDHYRV
jgi:nucleoside-diphosphate-sugar epimerase